MNLENTIKKASRVLRNHNIASHLLDAEVILSDILGTSREVLITNNEKNISNKDIKKYNQAIKRRINKEPVAYIIGKNWGRNPLYKNISPKKTWEGFWGGLIFSILASIFYYTLQSSFHFLVFVFSGIILPILATIGDLIQSKFKRKANVKNTGDLLPGHGGVLDRIDGILFAVPFGLIIMSYF